MVMMLSTTAILMIAVSVFAAFGVFSWLTGGKQGPATPPAPAAGPPGWLTPVVLVGMVVFGLRGGMPWFMVVFGSVFVVVMLVKLNVLTFGESTRSAAPAPPPLPRERGFPNATYHPTFAPPPRQRTGSRAATIFTALLLGGGLLLAIAATRMEVAAPPRNLQMVVSESWHDAMRDAHAELQHGMAQLDHELRAGAQEVSNAAEEVKRAMQRIPPPPPNAPSATIVVQEGAPKPPAGARPADLPAPGKTVSPAIQVTEQSRIDALMGRSSSGKVLAFSSKGKKESKKEPKREPKGQPAVVNRVPAVRVDYDRTPEELASFPVSDAPNGAYILLTNPNDQRDGYVEAYQRGLKLLRNHLLASGHSDLKDDDSLNLPPLSWAEANGLASRLVERLDDGRAVLAIGVNFSPKAVDLAYNYHLGCVRTREAAKGYFGGLLCLGGLGLLLRIGTGVRPTAPIPKV